jgi:hypothetical protein
VKRLLDALAALVKYFQLRLTKWAPSCFAYRCLNLIWQQCLRRRMATPLPAIVEILVSDVGMHISQVPSPLPIRFLRKISCLCLTLVIAAYALGGGGRLQHIYVAIDVFNISEHDRRGKTAKVLLFSKLPRL